jgi:four helix bundle protein
MKEGKQQNIKHFTDLDAWKINHELVLETYKVTKDFPKDERFGLTDQIRRASSSITANIAEGWGRYHFADKIKFYYHARGSNAEVQNFLILSQDLGYINEIQMKSLKKKVFQGFKVINGLIRSTERQR